MKHLKKGITVLMASLLIFASACNKDDNNPIDYTEFLGDCLLTKITWVDDSGNEVITVQYDDNRRVVRFDMVGEPYYGTFEYNTDGKLSKELVYENNELLLRSTFTWISNSATVMIEYKNESGEWVEVEKERFEFDADGQIIKLQGFDESNGVWEEGGYELFTWANGNITKSEEWDIGNKKRIFETRFLNKVRMHERENTLLKSTMDTKYSTTVYEYDNQNNAYASLGLFWGIITRNNEIKSVETASDGFTWTSNHVYEYNDKGFPTKITGTYSNSNGPVDSGVILLEYDCN